MPTPTDYLKKGALRAIEPAISFLARNNVNPNAITTVGTLLTVAAGVVYATGHIMTAGWIMAVTAFFDVLDGEVARKSGRSTVFGAFYDSTLDRVADGALMAGLTVFYATSPVHHNLYMVVVCLVGIIGTFLVSYTRARAESLGIDAKVGVMQRPERIVLEWMGAHRDHRPSQRHGVDHGRTKNRLRLSQHEPCNQQADSSHRRSSFNRPGYEPHESEGDAGLPPGAVLTKTEKEIGQIVRW
jgi:phosphatidylglycerophosphate synthase